MLLVLVQAEYDVPQCPAGTPVEECTHTISGVVTPPAGDMHFVGAHYHCHAPTCLKMEIFNNRTGPSSLKPAPRSVAASSFKEVR